MFTLILTLYIFAGGPAVGLTSVVGFHTLADCESAGTAWTASQSKGVVAKHLCVSVTQ